VIFRGWHTLSGAARKSDDLASCVVTSDASANYKLIFLDQTTDPAWGDIAITQEMIKDFDDLKASDTALRFRGLMLGLWIAANRNEATAR
jgi:hypothetical protein